MDFSPRSKDPFTQMNEDLGQLLHMTGHMAGQDKRELEKKVMNQIEQLIRDAEAIGGALLQEVQAIRRELGAYLQKPSEQVRVNVMRHAMHIKNKVREL